MLEIILVQGFCPLKIKIIILIFLMDLKSLNTILHQWQCKKVLSSHWHILQSGYQEFPRPLGFAFEADQHYYVVSFPELQTKRSKWNLLCKLAQLNSNFTLPLGYLNLALNNPALNYRIIPLPQNRFYFLCKASAR